MATAPPVRPTVERGRWLTHSWLSHKFRVGTRRRVVKVHDDGTATDEALGPMQHVDTDSVLEAVRDWTEHERGQ